MRKAKLPVIGYEVGHRERPDPFDPPRENSNEWKGIQRVSSQLDSLIITGLLNGQAYLVSVRTLVDGGMSAWSSPVLGIPVIPASGPVFIGGGGGGGTPPPPPPPPPSDSRLTRIELPEGFHIRVYAEGVTGARSMSLGSDGTLFVGTRPSGRVYALRDEDGDHKAERVITLASGLNNPNGVAFKNGDLYVAEISRILRYRNIEANLNNPPQPEIVNDAFPTDSSHGWKFIRFGPDGLLYVPVGAPCNICDSGDPYASIGRLDANGTFSIIARGIRNTVGFDWHPETGELWFTDNGRDRMGDDVPPDELNRITADGQHFGYPYCHGTDIADPQFGSQRNCGEFVAPTQELGPHVAALGMRFYTGNMFPAEYRNQIFIAEHGSWNRSSKIGYRITLVRLNANEAISYEPFAEGWLQGESSWGRPVDVLVMPDGSLLVSDDQAGLIYRISYSNAN